MVGDRRGDVHHLLVGTVDVDVVVAVAHFFLKVTQDARLATAWLGENHHGDRGDAQLFVTCTHGLDGLLDLVDVHGWVCCDF